MQPVWLTTLISSTETMRWFGSKKVGSSLRTIYSGFFFYIPNWVCWHLLCVHFGLPSPGLVVVGGGEISIGITGLLFTQFTRLLVRSLSTRIFCAKFKTNYTMKWMRINVQFVCMNANTIRENKFPFRMCVCVCV